MADAAAAQPLPIEPPQQQPASTPKEIKIETDLALDVPGGRGAGDWTVKGVDMRGNVQLTRPIPGGGLETRALSKEMYQAVRDLPQNRKRIKTKRASSDNQSITLDTKDDIRVVGFDAAKKEVLVEGIIDGAFTQEWISSTAVDKALRNEPNGLSDLTRVLAPHLSKQESAKQEEKKEKEQKGQEEKQAQSQENKEQGQEQARAGTQTQNTADAGADAQKQQQKQKQTVEQSVRMQAEVRAPEGRTKAPSNANTSNEPAKRASQVQAVSGASPVSTSAPSSSSSTVSVTSTPRSAGASASVSPITELRAELRAKKQTQKTAQQQTSGTSIQASIAANDNAVANDNGGAALAGLETVATRLVATQQQYDRDGARVAQEQAQVAQALSSIQQQLQQPQLSQDERANLEQQRKDLTARQTRLNSERASIDVARVQSDQQLADVQQAQQAIAQGASPEAYSSLIPPMTQLQAAQVAQSPQQRGPRVAAQQQPSSAAGQPGAVVAMELPSDDTSGVAVLADIPQAQPRIRIGVPPTLKQGALGRTTTPPKASASPTPIKPLQDNALTGRDESLPRARAASSVDGYASGGSGIPVHDSFDLQTPSYTQGLSPEPIDDADAEAQKLGTFQQQQQRQRRIAQQFSGLPADDVLGQSVSSGGGGRGTIIGSAEDGSYDEEDAGEYGGEGASEDGESMEQTEANRADALQEDQQRDRMKQQRDQAIQEAAQKQKDEVKKRAQKQLQEAFQKLKTGSKGASVTVALVLLYLLILHVQMINKIWPKSPKIPPSKFYEDLICIIVDILLLISLAIQIFIYTAPFWVMYILAPHDVTSALHALWNAI